MTPQLYLAIPDFNLFFLFGYEVTGDDVKTHIRVVNGIMHVCVDMQEASTDASEFNYINVQDISCLLASSFMHVTNSNDHEHHFHGLKKMLESYGLLMMDHDIAIFDAVKCQCIH